MIPAIDPKVDYKALVRRGYNACASAYNEYRKTVPEVEIRGLSARLDDGGAVLDVGCGAGVPITKSLAARHRVTGVDVSREMINLARRNVPAGDFICADIMTVSLPPSSFDAVVALYSVFHIPREEHLHLFRRVHRWLKPGGLLLCTLSYHSEEGYTEEDFFGTTMYWSNYSLEQYVEMLTGVGFAPLATESTRHAHACEGTIPESNEDHPLVLARRGRLGRAERRRS